MNDIFEFWSLPWHALQRSLASGFDSETVAIPTHGSAHRCSGAAAPPTGNNWLARARSGIAPARQAVR